MTGLRDDPRRRIFVGQNFLVGDVAEPLIPALEAFLSEHPQALALLEFTSPGPQTRQIDCALISPGGIDLIEVKNKRGLVTGTADGEWRVRRGPYDDPVMNRKRGRSENPYQQAYHTADDLQAGLRRLLGRRIRVTPLVLLPSPDPASAIAGHSNVNLALGIENLRVALRSAPLASGGGWNRADHLTLPERLGLTPLHLSFVCGRITDAAERRGVAEVDVWADVAGERYSTRTDEEGHYRLAVTLGQEIELGFSPPELFVPPPPLHLRADRRFLEAEDVRLARRFSLRTEDEIRSEVVREVEARVQQHVDRFRANWDNAQASMGLVIDDLTGQLRAARLRLAEQEQQLQARFQPLPDAPRLPLPVHVRQVHELRVAQEQRGQVDRALQTLQAADNSEQRGAVRHALDLLTHLEISARHQLAPPAASALAPRVLSTAPRLPPPALPVSEPNSIAVQVKEAGVSVSSRSRPEEPVHSSVSPVPTPHQGRQRLWPLLVLVLGAAASGAVATWLMQPRHSSAAPLRSTSPAVPPAAADRPLPPREVTQAVEASPVADPSSPVSVAVPVAAPSAAVVEVATSQPTQAPSPPLRSAPPPERVEAVPAPTPTPAAAVRRTAPAPAAAAPTSPAQPRVPPQPKRAAEMTPRPAPTVQRTPVRASAVPPEAASSTASAQPTPAAERATAPPAPRPPQPARAAPVAAPLPPAVATPAPPPTPPAAQPDPVPTADTTDLPGEVVETAPAPALPAAPPEEEPLPGVPVE